MTVYGKVNAVDIFSKAFSVDFVYLQPCNNFLSNHKTKYFRLMHRTFLYSFVSDSENKFAVYCFFVVCSLPLLLFVYCEVQWFH